MLEPIWLVDGTGAGADFEVVTDVANSPVASWFAPDPSWRVEARYEPYAAPRAVGTPNILGTTYDAQVPGATRCDQLGMAADDCAAATLVLDARRLMMIPAEQDRVAGGEVGVSAASCSTRRALRPGSTTF